MKLRIIALCGLLALPLATGGCAELSGVLSGASTQETVSKAYATSEASLTIAAKSATTAVNAGAITPGSDTAKAVQKGLDSASLALDAANTYLNAGLYDQAQAQVDAGQSQIDTINSVPGVAK